MSLIATGLIVILATYFTCWAVLTIYDASG